METTGRGHYGLLSFVFLCLLAVLLCIAADGWRSWLLLTTWTLGSGTRLYYGDRQVVTDCFLFGVVYSWLARADLMIIALKRWDEAIASVPVKGSSTPYVASVITIALALVGLPLWRARQKSRTLLDLPPGVRKWTLDHPKPRIFPCQTTHARMFPKRHAFEYSYLQCGYPIAPDATTAEGLDISVGNDRKLGKWWLRVRADDYLDRGNGVLGLYGKLKLYLSEQHIKDSDWSYAYLITAPRFFGYAFNPVSFWYIYDQEHQLMKMILEFNNTFGERRMYLLDGSNTPTPGSPRSSIARELEPQSRFTDIWMKDFHVSPFNSRKGSYSLKALNLFPYVSYQYPTIDNSITLRSSKDHTKLIARIHSTGKSLDPSQLSLFETLHFISSWWWVGLMTVPRGLREAFKLCFWRKLHLWFRPEVLTSTIGRLPTASEVVLHKVFTDYLTQLVHQTEDTFCITFKSGIPDIPTEMIARTHERGHGQSTKYLEIRVLTPAFYTRLVHYAYTSEAIDRECIFTDERNRTLWMCRPQLLPLLLSERSSIQIKEEGLPIVKRGCLDELRWLFLKKLRCPPADPAYSVTPQSSAFSIDDIRSRPYSELDNFVRSFRGRIHAGEYRRAVTKIFLAQHFSYGYLEVIDLVDLILRVLLCYFGVLQFQSFGSLGEGHGDWWSISKSAVSMFACHAYGLLKGYR